VAYVGDRPDNDVAPANALGLFAVRVNRGPHAGQAVLGDGQRADVEGEDLEDAAQRLLAWGATRAPSGDH
jgi:FMN phosphatase YigB (HAD superfamily)